LEARGEHPHTFIEFCGSANKRPTAQISRLSFRATTKAEQNFLEQAKKITFYKNLKNGLFLKIFHKRDLSKTYIKRSVDRDDFT
jgi:hypothetical protein